MLAADTGRKNTQLRTVKEAKKCIHLHSEIMMGIANVGRKRYWCDIIEDIRGIKGYDSKRVWISSRCIKCKKYSKYPRKEKKKTHQINFKGEIVLPKKKIPTNCKGCDYWENGCIQKVCQFT